MVWGNWFLSFEVSLVIVIIIAMGIGIVILALGLICMKKSRRRKTYDKPVNLVQPQQSINSQQQVPNGEMTLAQKRELSRAGVFNMPNSAIRPSLPPPASFLMEHDTIVATENEYAYISEMPPPPTPSPPHSPKCTTGEALPPPPPPMDLVPVEPKEPAEIDWPELPPFILETDPHSADPQQTLLLNRPPSDRPGKHTRSKSRPTNVVIFSRDRDYGSCDATKVPPGGHLVPGPDGVMSYNFTRTYFELDPNQVPFSVDPLEKYDFNQLEVSFQNYQAKTICKTKRHSGSDKHSHKPGTV